MRQQGKDVKDSWPKTVVKKWLNINKDTDQFQSDYKTKDVSRRRGKSCSDDGLYAVVPEEFSEEWLMDTSDEIGRPGFNQVTSSPSNDLNQLRMFVGTWNVAGKSPENGLNLIDWVKTKAQVDVYVLGFQEIVPLNAGNVLGPEDCGPAAKWLSLIRKALNGDTTGYVTKQSPSQEQLSSKPRVSFSDLIALEDEELNEQRDFKKFSDNRSNSGSSEEGSTTPKHRYSLVASKQMVGIFLCIWVREDLYKDISSVKVSCVGRGIMRCLGNKGSISVSMTLRQMSFCFVCTHLASGEKEGDAMRRNLDVMEILKRTRFSSSCRCRGKPKPCTILAHDKIIWLGDLNYRLAPSCGDKQELLDRSDWQALLEKDELRIEQKAGRVFKDWEEGEICFAPTYKYLANSDCYVVHTLTSKEKRRIPAWCDRILWKGEGINQMCYVRGESSFSDHRPVYSLFSVDLESPNKTNMKMFKSTAGPDSLPDAEFLLVNRTQSCIQSTPRFSITGKRCQASSRLPPVMYRQTGKEL